MIVYENPWFRVVRQGRYHFIDEPAARNGAVIVARRGDALVLLEQRRPSQGGAATLEVPRGYGEAGETAAQCAAREFAEETGLIMPAEAFHLIGHVRPNTGILSSRIAAFYADASAAPLGARDDEAEALRLAPLAGLDAMIASGEIEDGFTLAALSLWRASEWGQAAG